MRLVGLSDGRDDAYESFVADAEARLRSIAYLMCGDWHRAEDVVQRVLMRLYIR